MTTKIPFDSWMLRERQTDPVVRFDGLTSCTDPAHALAVFTTIKGRQLEAAGPDVRRLQRELDEEIRVVPGLTPVSPAHRHAVRKQLAVVTTAQSALNERRNMGVLETGMDTGLFSPHVPAEPDLTEQVHVMLNRISGDARRNAEAARDQLHTVLNVTITSATVKRERQLNALAKARAAKASRRQPEAGL